MIGYNCGNGIRSPGGAGNTPGASQREVTPVTEPQYTRVRLCSAPGCNRPWVARKYCHMHYERWRRTGSIERAPQPSTEERFWSCVRKTPTCWIWEGPINSDGYGRFSLPGDGKIGAHCFAYQLLVGPVPEGLVLDHVRDRGCLSRACVNPAHMEPVTTRENLLRGDTHARRNAEKTHCIHGHPFDAENTRVCGGRRHCRICLRDTDARYKARRARERARFGITVPSKE